MRFLAGLLILICAFAGPACAADEVVPATAADGQTFRYLLTTSGETPRYAVILMPGGAGTLNPRMENGKLAMAASGNFLIRSRGLFAAGPFVAASTDATTSPDRILAIVRDLERRYGKLAVYVIGTSRSSESTMALAKPLDGQVAGLIHTSSMNAISSFDTRPFKSRHLIVIHNRDACRATKPSAGAAASRSYGADLIAMDGGKSTGDDCEAYAHHGYYGIEKETVDKIKAWITAGK